MMRCELVNACRIPVSGVLLPTETVWLSSALWYVWMGKSSGSGELSDMRGYKWKAVK